MACIEALTLADDSGVLALTDATLSTDEDWKVHKPLVLDLWRMAGSCVYTKYSTRPSFAREEGALLPFLSALHQRLPEKKAPSLCVICFDKNANVAVIPCGHVCLCSKCRPMFEEQPAPRRCPVCRTAGSLHSLFFS